MSRPILVSACLLGLLTRYDGQTKCNQKVLDFLKAQGLVPIPVCPEQLAGLSTPRPATFFSKGDGRDLLDGKGTVVNRVGDEMNAPFLRGAAEVLKIARISGATLALFKERSPSCGVHQVYLEETIIAGQGVTSALLQRNGLSLCSEDDI
ncbi:hypothetical protein DSOUD_1697 [Desulfuromonas soudanensis]|uniref:Uncharacterized protein n=1 Tax=Desulfuromonas soudanensis TaxID=1603606 RepID=A0A0M4DHE5_9BACT|nr:DUF523 domain-containing protein [Desulfuromonas soudanensis]ALC16475.1 hypothetical protein DSOUD_1697 [Desulfuromonas soudanensis]